MLELVSLNELGEIVSGSTPNTETNEYWNGDIPWITPADLTGNYEVYFKGKLRKITEAGFKSCSTKMLPKGSIIFSSRAPIGHCALTSYPLCTNQGFKSLIPNKRLDSLYGYYALRFLTPSIVVQGRGATFGEINKEIFENVRVPFREINEQRRIAAILDKADRLRRQRRFAQTLSDSFLQSVFIKMFGDPLINPNGHPIQKVCKSLRNIRYGTGSPPEYQSKGIPFIRATNVKGGTIVPKEMVFISEAEAKKISKCEIKEGDLIIVRSGANTGDCAMIPKQYDKGFAAYDLIVEIDYPTNYFYNSLINSIEGKAIIVPLTRRAGQPHLNAEQVGELEFPFPPLALQEKFAAIVQKFERIRRQQREATRQAEHLFQTLLHRAFRGEL